MATSSININGTLAPLLTASIGSTYTLSNSNNVGVNTWKWEIADKPPGSTATLTTSTSATATIQPDKQGSYLIRLIVNGDTISTAVISVPTELMGLRIPAANEKTEVDSTRGWATAISDALLAAEREIRLGPVVTCIAMEAITQGDPVYTRAVATTTTGHVLSQVYRAFANDPTKLPVIGVATYTASVGQRVNVRIAGLLSESMVNTSGWTAGAPVYVSDTGTLSNLAGTNAAIVGFVQSVAASGRVYIAPAQSSAGGASQWTSMTGGIEYTGGNVHIGSTTTSTLTKLHVVHDPGVSAGAGPYLSLQNPRGASGAHVGIDFWTYGVGDKPGARIVSVDDGSYGSSIKFQTKVPGAPNNALVDRWIIQNNGHINIDSGTLYVDVDSNRVGIGTTGPQNALDVRGSMGATVADGVAGIYVSNGTNSTLAIAPVGSGQTRIKTDFAGRWMSFADGAGATDVMVVRGGNVGIGETNPQTALHVVANNTTAAGWVQNKNTGGWASTAYFDAVGVYKFGVGYGNSAVATLSQRSTAYINVEDVDFVVFNKGASELMRIKSTGNVGIGESNPQAPLHVKGSSRMQAVDATTGGAYTSYDNTGTYKMLFGYYGASHANPDRAGKSVIETANLTPLVFTTNDTSPVERMRLTPGGNFGIGDSNPAEKLTVAGNVKLTGASNGVIFPDGSKQTTAATGGASQWTTVNTTDINYSLGNVGVAANDPKSTFEVNGSSAAKVVEHLNAGTLGNETYAILNASGATGFTITLPLVSTCLNRVYHIKRLDSSANATTISRSGTDSIYTNTGTQTSITITSTDGCITLVASVLGWVQF